MASIVFFIEMPDWLWHCDHALDSMFIMGWAQVQMYIFFYHYFFVFVFIEQFDLEVPFNEVPLFMAHPWFLNHLHCHDPIEVVAGA